MKCQVLIEKKYSLGKGQISKFRPKIVLNVLPKLPYILFANSWVTQSFEFYFHITVDSTNDIGGH